MNFVIYGDVYTNFSHISVNYLFQYIYDRLHSIMMWLFMVDLSSVEVKWEFCLCLEGVKIFYPLCVILEFLIKSTIKYSGCITGN